MVLLRVVAAVLIIGLQAFEAYLFIWGLKVPWRFAGWLIAAFVLFNLALPYMLWLQAGARQAPLWATALIVRPTYAWHFNWIAFLVFLLPLILLGRFSAWALDMETIITGMRWFILSIVALWTAATIFGLVGTLKPPLVETHEVAINGLHKNDRGLRIVQLSDPHVGWWNSKEEICKIGRIVERLEPDLLLISGDMIDHHPDYVHALADCLENVKPRLGRYAIIGNHDVYTGREQIAQRMELRGFRMLRNECLSLEDRGARLMLAGVEDSGTGWTGKDPWEKKIPALLRYCKTDIPLIFMSHRPPAFATVEGLPVDLMLSGHTHGGQLKLPLGGPGLADLTFKYTSGLHQRNGQSLYVSRGTGTVGWPFRIACPGELTLFILR